VLIGTPAAAGLFFLAAPVLTTLFQYGAFSVADVEMAALSLMAYSVGLLGFILVKVLVPGFTARQDMKTPVRIGVIAVVCNMLLSVSLVFVWQHAGLALATSFAAFVNAGLLLRGLLKEGVYKPGTGWTSFIIKVSVANLVAGVCYYFGFSLSEWVAWSAFERVTYLALEIGKVVVIYFVCLYALGLRVRQLMPEKIAT
jgi:putative peptidoglycan lipid II flippase